MTLLQDIISPRLTVDYIEHEERFLMGRDDQVAAYKDLSPSYVRFVRQNNFLLWEIWEKGERLEGARVIAANQKRRRLFAQKRSDMDLKWEKAQADLYADEFPSDPPTWHEKGWRLSQFVTPLLISALLYIAMYMAGSFAWHHLVKGSL
jgi:hypothetical protein